MRQGKNDEWIRMTNNSLMSVDFHDFIQRVSAHQPDMEIAQEMGLSIREVRRLKRKMQRS